MKKPTSHKPEVDGLNHLAHFVYSIYDRKAFVYGPLMSCTSDLDATRGITQFLSNPSLLTQFPTDYELVCLGSFDCSSGLFDGGKPRSLGLIVDFMEAPNGR